MNIGFLIPTLHKGGAEKIAAELSKALPEEWKIYFILFEDKISYDYRGEIISINIPMENGLRELFLIPRRAKRLKEIIEDKRIEVVMSFDEIASLVNIFSNSNAGKIVAIHKSLVMADREKNFLKRFMAKFLRKNYNKACKVICVSEGIREDLVQYVGINKNRVKVIYNPYNISKIKELGRKKVEIDLPNKFILNIGRAEMQKGQWYLLRAFKEVKKVDKEVKLVIIARGKLIDYLKDLRKKLKLEKDVIIIEKWINNIYPIIKESEIFVLSSLFEGFSNVLLEALALNRPIISSDCRSGPGEIIGKVKEIKDGYKIGERGILIEAFDGKLKKAEDELTKEEKALADAIIRLMKDRELRKKLSENGKKYVERFDRNKIIREYVELFEECKRKAKR